MLQRVERHPPGPPSGIIAELVGDETVGRLMEGHGENDRKHPSARLIDHSAHPTCHVHCCEAPLLSPGEERLELCLGFFPVKAVFYRTTHRFAARESFPRTRRYHSRLRTDLLHLSGASVTVEGEVATGRKSPPCPLVQSAVERVHRQIVRDEHTIKADFSADDLSDHCTRQCRRRCRVDCRIDDVRSHRPGHRRQCPEGRKIGACELYTAGLYDRASIVAVDHRPSVTGYMLDDRKYRAIEQTTARRTREPNDPFCIVTVGTVADDRVSCGSWKIQDRQTIDSDAQQRQIVADQSRAQPD